MKMRRILSLGLMCVMVFSLVCVTGCGGGSGSSDQTTQESSGKKKIRKKIRKKINMEEPEQEEDEDSDEAEVSEEPSKEEVPVVEEKPRELPEKVADWTPDDFLFARATKAKELDDALAFLTEPSEKNVAILASLITKPESPTRGEAPAPAEPQQDEEGNPMRVEEPQPEEFEVASLTSSQVRAVVDALIAWKTPEADAVLEKIIHREILTDDDKTVVEQILDAFGKEENFSPTRETLMLSLLLDADKARPLVEAPQEEEKQDENGRRIDPDTYWTTDGKYIHVRYTNGNRRTTDVTPAEIRARVLDRYGKIGTSAFRLEVARFLTNPEIDPSYLNDEEKKGFVLKLLAYLMEDSPENLSAQLVLYRQNALDVNNTQKIETTLLACQEALCRSWFLLGEEKDVSEFLVAFREYQESKKPAKAEKQDGDSAEEKPTRAGLLGHLTQAKATPQEGPATRTRKDLSLFLEFVLEPEKAEKLRKELWSPEFVALLQKRMAMALIQMVPRNVDLNADEMPKLERVSERDLAPFQMFLLIPCDEVRRTAFTLFQKGWSMGPEVFRQAGLLERMPTEPGFLLAVKSVKRDDAEPELSEKEKEREAKKAKNRLAKISEAAVRKEREQKIAVAWQGEVFKQIQAWMKKLEQAAEMRRIQKGTELAEVKVPESFVKDFALPEEFSTVAFYLAKDPVLGEEKDVKGGLKMSYAHVQMSTRYSAYLSALKKAGLELRNVGERGRSENVLWLERFEVNDAGRRISVDVFLERDPEAVRAEQSGNENDGKKRVRVKENREPEDLDVYILRMEGSDFTEETPAEKPTARTTKSKSKKGE